MGAQADVGIIGGTGLQRLAELRDVQLHEVSTPFGEPSDAIALGTLGGQQVAFLPRHGRHHGLLPTEINVRANIYALKLLGVQSIVSVCAVGSLRDDAEVGQAVLPDQFIDCTVARPSTFFGGGVVAHVSLARPVCPHVQRALAEGARPYPVQQGGVYLCIEGPQFSTRAESALWRRWGAHVVGMTGLPEARLAREAEICYGMLALITDHDAWRSGADAVDAATVAHVQRRNTAMARATVAATVALLADRRVPCTCGHSLDAALMTPPTHIDTSTRRRLAAILQRRLNAQPS